MGEPAAPRRMPTDPEGASDGDRPSAHYRVELWAHGGTDVERVLAVTATAALAYAAYCAALQEFPGQMITIRHHAGEASREGEA